MYPTIALIVAEYLNYTKRLLLIKRNVQANFFHRFMNHDTGVELLIWRGGILHRQSFVFQLPWNSETRDLKASQKVLSSGYLAAVEHVHLKFMVGVQLV